MESDNPKKIPRQESLILPTVLNPFAHKLPDFTTLDKVQIALMSVTIFPLRVLIIGILLIIAWVIAKIALFGRPKEEENEPLEGWRKFATAPLLYMGRAIFFAAGFHTIRYRGRLASSRDAPVLVVAPHSSFLDSVALFLGDRFPSPISRIEQKHVPVSGTLTAYTQPVFVSREDPDSRQNTIREIKRRAASAGRWPQIIIFPEGTCTNRTCLITFKQGAFIPAVPVQPVALKYTNKYDTTTWTWEGPGAFTLFWLTLCQFNNKLEVEFLPVYSPNEEEKKDPTLFARNVRAKMAECLGVPVTDHTFEDCRLMRYAAQLNMPCASVIVEFQKLSRKLGVKYDNLKALLEKFSAVAQQSEGLVTLEQFARHIDMPVSDALRQMFDLYDRDGSGTIDFREYVIGLHLIAKPANTDETLRFAFKLFDAGDKGHVTEAELCDVLQRAFGMQREAVHRIFAQIERQDPGHITFDEFKAYAEKRPEYASLFTTYQQQQQQTNHVTRDVTSADVTSTDVTGSDVTCIQPDLSRSACSKDKTD